MKFRTATEIWDSLEKDLKCKINSCIRTYYEEKESINMILWEEEGSYEDLKEDLEHLLKCVGDLPGSPQGTSHRQGGTNVEGDLRAQTQSRFCADLENQSPDIKEFRNEYLDGKRLENSEEVDRWLDRQAFGEEEALFGPRLESEICQLGLEYYDPGNRVDYAERGTVLAHLRELANRLTSRSPWSKGQATWFILTGKPPQTYMLSSTVLLQGPSDATIIMHILPRTPPGEVLDAYRKVRKELLSNVRIRDTSEREVRLLEFERSNQGMPRDKLHKEWNRISGDRIDQFVNFNRDLNNARERLHSSGVRDLLLPNVTHEEWERLRSESARIAAERAQQSGESGDAKS